jgi:hypothetical protein
MRKLPVTQIICCAAAALAISTATTYSDQSDQSSSQSGQSGAWQKAQAQEFFRASKIIGKSTQTTDNQKVGSIKDVVFNQQGEIFALVDVGNSRLAVVPWQAISATTLKGSQNATINTTQQALKSGPAVTKDQWGSLDNPSFTQGVYTYYHLQPPSATGGASSPGGASQGQGSDQGQPQPQEQNQNQPK